MTELEFEPRLFSARVPEHHRPPRLSFLFSVLSASVPPVDLAHLWARLSRTCRNPWPMVHVLEVRGWDWSRELRVHEAAFLLADFTLGHQTAGATSLRTLLCARGAGLGAEEGALIFSF